MARFSYFLPTVLALVALALGAQALLPAWPARASQSFTLLDETERLDPVVGFSGNRSPAVLSMVPTDEPVEFTDELEVSNEFERSRESEDASNEVAAVSLYK